VSEAVPKSGILIMMPEAVVFHTTTRKDDACTTAFYPIVVTKSKNKLKFDSHMIFFGLAQVEPCVGSADRRRRGAVKWVAHQSIVA
jgi:hypothetical protein